MSEKLVSALWLRMQSTYGHLWNSLFKGDDAIESWRATWGASIAGLTREQIKHGVERMAAVHQEHPPTLGQFIALCKAFRIPAERHIPGPKFEPTEEQRAALRDAANAHKSTPWRWTPDKVVNDTQAQHVLESKNHGYPPGVSFFNQCVAAGVMRADGSLIPVALRQEGGNA